MAHKIVKLEIKDNITGEVFKTYYLLNPNHKKLAKIKEVVEHYSDYCDHNPITWEEFEMVTELEGKGFVEGIDFMIKTSFILLDIDEDYCIYV